MTTPERPSADAQRRCGAAVRRCTGCERPVGSYYATCPACGSADIVDSTCRRPLKAGAVRCYYHGANTPQALAAVDQREVEGRLAAMLEEYDAGPVINPLEALLTVAGRAMAWTELCGDRLAALRQDSWRYQGRLAEQTRAEVLLFERSMDRAARVLADIARLGIEDRLARVEEAEAVQLALVIDRMLAAAIPAEFHDRARDVLAAELAALDGGGVR